MSDPAAFLLARYAEEEAGAHRVAEAYSSEDFWAPGVVINASALVTPARVLADIAAKRAVVEHVQEWAPTLHETPDGWTPETATTYRMAMDWTLRALTQPYAGHPDWREEWAT
jgi:hypothetical protein